jgi:hypothetical protein
MNIKRLNTINIWFVFVGILIFHLFLLIKIKFTAWPEMLLWPYLMLNGLSPYKDIAIAHTPLLIFDLAVFFKIFGLGIIQLKIFTWVLIAVTDLLIFLISKRLYGKKVAVISTMVFAVIQTYFDGNGLWFDLALSSLALINFYFVREKKYLAVGVITSLMFLTKQTAFWFFVPLLAEIVATKKETKKNIVKLLKGAVFTGVVFLVGISLWGVLGDFWFWVIKYGIFTLPLSQGQIQLPGIRSLVVSLYPFLILLLYMLKKARNPKYLILWVFAGAMAAYPRFEFFHFQPALPFLALGAGLTLSRINLPKGFIIKTFLTLYLVGFLYLFSSFFIRNYNEGTRFHENDVQRVVEYVRNNTSPEDKIFVINWWDHVYALTDTLPATRPWVPQLEWYQELPGIKEKEVRDLSVNRPKLIVFQNRSDFGLSSYIPDKVLEFVMSDYIVKEKIDNINILVLK